MSTPEHICAFGLKSLDLPQRGGFEVEDHRLKNRAETDALMVREGADTTPQTFVGANRVGDHDDLRCHNKARKADRSGRDRRGSLRR